MKICSFVRKERETGSSLFDWVKGRTRLFLIGFAETEGAGFADADGEGFADADGEGFADADGEGFADADGEGFADADGEGFADADGEGFADADGEQSRGGLVSIRQSRMEGSCEARRIVDPSTMGSSLSDNVGWRGSSLL